MKALLLLLSVFNAPIPTEGIPQDLHGRWIVRRVIPTHTISCWGDKQSQQLIGTEIEYTARSFRWQGVQVNHPQVHTETISGEEFFLANRGSGSSVSFEELGIDAKEAKQITIEHPPADITGATVEIPGDQVLIKSRDAIVFSACNVYFEAQRVVRRKEESAAPARLIPMRLTGKVLKSRYCFAGGAELARLDLLLEYEITNEGTQRVIIEAGPYPAAGLLLKDAALGRPLRIEMEDFGLGADPPGGVSTRTPREVTLRPGARHQAKGDAFLFVPSRKAETTPGAIAPGRYELQVTIAPKLYILPQGGSPKRTLRPLTSEPLPTTIAENPDTRQSCDTPLQ